MCTYVLFCLVPVLFKSLQMCLEGSFQEKTLLYSSCVLPDLNVFVPVLRYEQPNGYRPSPVDLSQVFLSSEQEEVVNLLAENDHNVWARDRINQGWTYGTQQVFFNCFTALVKHCCRTRAFKQLTLILSVNTACSFIQNFFSTLSNDMG